MQLPLRKLLRFNSLAIGSLVLCGYAAIHRLPVIPARPAATIPIRYDALPVPMGRSLFRTAGVWRIQCGDMRLQGLSGLTQSGDRLVAISDLGAAALLDLPGHSRPTAELSDLRDGPGSFGSKKNRDAEAIVGDGAGGWYVAFENRHSVWQYGGRFGHGVEFGPIDRPQWPSNTGVEGLIESHGRPIAFAQSGREILSWSGAGWTSMATELGWQVADAATAPDGSVWLLLRSISVGGFDEAIAPLVKKDGRYKVGPVLRFPKRPFDNFEGMTIMPQAGGLRFWLVSDDGHYLWPHTILMALDLPRTYENARR